MPTTPRFATLVGLGHLVLTPLRALAASIGTLAPWPQAGSIDCLGKDSNAPRPHAVQCGHIRAAGAGDLLQRRQAAVSRGSFAGREIFGMAVIGPAGYPARPTQGTLIVIAAASYSIGQPQSATQRLFVSGSAAIDPADMPSGMVMRARTSGVLPRTRRTLSPAATHSDP